MGLYIIHFSKWPGNESFINIFLLVSFSEKTRRNNIKNKLLFMNNIEENKECRSMA